ncbi:hypothetical protein NDU88_010967 [Pleurodeles waltl]|uniref:Secreted protein n=1 Tax=Pleurodeles waltl TaxID=8319 RepID=A0AAV7PXA6_PLEWA|nr:hypothetical protein NDU88_010967 [Pleurodeles waltl]
MGAVLGVGVVQGLVAFDRVVALDVSYFSGGPKVHRPYVVVYRSPVGLLDHWTVPAQVPLMQPPYSSHLPLEYCRRFAHPTDHHLHGVPFRYPAIRTVPVMFKVVDQSI